MALKPAHPIDIRILRSMWSRTDPMPVAAKDLSSFGKPAAIRQALSRLAKTGKLRRIRRGLYERPRPHPIIGQAPSSSMDVVRVMMEHRNAPWQVSGANAANLLGISEQVPAHLEIQTTAHVPTVTLGKSKIRFNRVAPSSLIGAGTEVGTVIQAIRYLGRSGVESAHVKRLQRTLSARTKGQLQKVSVNLPQWMRPIIAEITRPSETK